MEYFIDTEFLEGTQDKNFLGINYGKTKSTIDLISIGIVSSDGREYYAISKDFNLKEAWNRYELLDDNSVGVRIGCLPNKKKVYWIRENVLKPIFEEWVKEDSHWTNKDCTLGNWKFTYKNFKYFLQKEGKTNKQIAFEILNFVHGHDDIGDWLGTTDEYYNTLKNSEPKEPPQFYAYFADYDWVAFCWIFGKMIDLPKEFPMYCIDLNQTLQYKCDNDLFDANKHGYTSFSSTSIKKHPDYPKQTNEHNALADAKWNKELYNFLLNLND